MSTGIDYGMGQTNIDHNTGVRYGVISLHSLGEFALESFEADYEEPTCPECGEYVLGYNDAEHGGYEGTCCDYACEHCKLTYDSSEVYGEDPLEWNLEDGEYIAILGNDDNDIFITKSPYYTYASFCSPCAPGACSLNYDGDAESGLPKAYCFGVDWFEDNKAPYHIYSVKTGELLYSPSTAENEVG